MVSSTYSDDEEQESLFQRALSTALLPIEVLTSRPLIKAYLSTLLFFLTSFVLLAISTSAFLFFYYNYIPQVDLSCVIHLQYGTPGNPYPHAHTLLETSALTSGQPYDVSLELYLPRTPSNLAAGNFMLELALLSPSNTPSSVPSALSNVTPNTTTTLAHSRRPAILPYTSPILSLSQTLTSLPLHFLGFRDPDATTLHIPMFERVAFNRGWRNIPSSVNLEIQSQPHSDIPLQVYSAKVIFQARFQGLRWFLYNYRILSWLIFSAIFYTATLSSMTLIWVVFSSSSSPTKETAKLKTESDTAELSNGQLTASTSKAKGKGKAALKEEGDTHTDSQGDTYLDNALENLSDTPTTFPTLSRQMPLRFPVQRTPSETKNIKRESPELDQQVAIDAIVPATAEDAADDEDEEDEEEQRRGLPTDDRPFDSGIGTSMESENVTAAGLQRRRSSRGLKEKE